MKILKRPVVLAVICGFLIGTLWLVGLRFFTYQSEAVHYHANFALYINGKKDEFKSFTFYEEVQACADESGGNPKSRVHLHDNDPNVVHVHADAVTWGHFFANLGYGLSNKSVTVGGDVLAEAEQGGPRLTFILNGQEVETIANEVIQSEDTLLISYGEENDAVLKERYDTIPRTAGEFNGKYDPAGCSGGEQLTFTQRFKHALGF